MSRCNSCGHAITWARSLSTGKRIPINAEEDPTGNVVLSGKIGVDGVPIAIVAGARTIGQLPVDAVRYRSHFATCPHAGSWRRRKG